VLRRSLALGALLASACSSGASIPADRPILGWWGSTASDANRAALPTGFTAPDVHACAADPTRAYIAELFFNGIDDVQVLNHWAPIVPGPNPHRATLGQPELSLSGTVVGGDDSGDDVLGDHPFGYDVDVDVKLDASSDFLAFEGSGAKGTPLHTEVEMRAFPRAALGFSPQAGDRVLMRGAWVLDCGHPPYGAEMHPPTFIEYARSADARTTVAAAVVVPYRSTLLFNPDPALATDFPNAGRFSSPYTQPFSKALLAAIESAVFSGAERLTAHGLMMANRFDKLDWLVCAPLPRPAGATLQASWRLTARTGVAVQASSYEANGCVRFTATMSDAYTPMPLPHVDADWPWDQLSASAGGQLGQSVDVRQAIIDILKKKGLDASQMPALQPDHPPRIDAYPALQTRPGAEADAPTAIEVGADDQPFPLHGRIRVGWK
jgi:hypothetical protein